MFHPGHSGCAVDSRLGSSEMPSKLESSLSFLGVSFCFCFFFFLPLSLCLSMCGSQKSGDELIIFRIVAGIGLRDVSCSDGIN